MHHDFVVHKWSIWPFQTEESDLSEKELLSTVPRMLKRRLTPLARIVFCAASQCIDEDTESPIVFSSTHGELAKSFKMMEMIEAGEEISPTAFSLSVHNSIAGLFSMVYKNKTQCTVVAPGEEGISAAFIEALGLLDEGEQDVLIVLYDEPLVSFYPSAPYQLTTDSSSAIALMLRKTGDGIPLRFSCENETGDDGEQPLHVPLLAQFLAENQKELIIHTPRHRWCWKRND